MKNPWTFWFGLEKPEAHCELEVNWKGLGGEGKKDLKSDIIYGQPLTRIPITYPQTNL